MKYQIGVDVFDISRMKKAIKQDNPVYFEAVFTPQEQAAAREHSDLCTYFATRFALKEAAFKALNTYWTEEMEWNQIFTTGSDWQAPVVTYTGAMKRAADHIGVTGISASLSYDKSLAFAAVIIETESTTD